MSASDGGRLGLRVGGGNCSKLLPSQTFDEQWADHLPDLRLFLSQYNHRYIVHWVAVWDNRSQWKPTTT